MSDELCLSCFRPLTDEEKRYYEYRCEACEGEWVNALNRWREGESNPVFDKLYGGN